MVTFTETHDHESMSQALSQAAPPDEVHVWWLGQAGFAMKYEETLLLIDPYLSDFLAKKYKGKEFPHIRMMKSPLQPEDVRNVNLILCTHRHSDHMDPETLLPIARNNPECRCVLPKAESGWGRKWDCQKLR